MQIHLYRSVPMRVMVPSGRVNCTKIPLETKWHNGTAYLAVVGMTNPSLVRDVVGELTGPDSKTLKGNAVLKDFLYARFAPESEKNGVTEPKPGTVFVVEGIACRVIPRDEAVRIASEINTRLLEPAEPGIPTMRRRI